MAKRVQALATAISRDYGGNASRVWTDARDGPDLEERLMALPSIGPMKAKSIMAVLAKQLGVNTQGLAQRLPTHPTLGDVDSSEALASYQAGKRAHKAAMRAQG